MIKGGPIFKAFNALGGIACILVGIFLPQLDFIFVSQTPGSDAFTLIQAHWVAVGAISVLISKSKSVNQFWIALLLVWVILNGWLGGKALLVGDGRFLWVLAFPILSLLNYGQFLVQDGSSDDAIETPDAALEPPTIEPQIPADFHQLKSPSPIEAIHGMIMIIAAVVIQLGLMVGFFFYGALMVRILFEGANVTFARIFDGLGGAVWDIVYIPVIIVVVYSLVVLIQFIVEKTAIGGGSANGDDVNRDLSIHERTFIEQSLQKVKKYIDEAEFPAFYPWLHLPSIISLIAVFIALPLLVVWIEYEFFSAVEIPGIPHEEIIGSMGPAYIGGAMFGFLFGTNIYWAAVQWLGARFRRYGEYLHIRWGWNSMNSEARPLEAYAKIFTRFVRKRRYAPDQSIEPQKFIHDAYDEFGGFLYKVTIVLGIAAVLFTALDVNWRRITHTGGLHYSPYLDFRSYDLSLDEIVRVEVRCFLYGADDHGKRNPGVGYDVVFSNGMRGYYLSNHPDDALLDKVEAIDKELTMRGIPKIRAEHAGPIILRSINGYRSDCRETVLSKFDADIRSRLEGLLQAELPESSPKN